MVEAGRWCKKGCGVTVGEPSGDSAGHVGGRCTPVHPGNEVYKYDGPRKGPQAIRGVRGVPRHPVSVLWKVSGEGRERAGCIELI